MRGSRCTLALLFALATGIAGAVTTSETTPTVRWLTLDFPPLFILSGPEHGVGDYAQGIAVANLSGYEHVSQAVPPNYQRIEQEMKSHGDVCFAGFLKTPERERFMVFSEPYLMMLPVQLYVPAGRAQPPAVLDGQVDLQQLLATGTFRLGLLGGRRYGATVDPVVEAYKDSTAVYRRFSKDQLGGLLTLLAAHEHSLDGVLSYSNEITYLAAQPGAKLIDLRAYPLKGAPAFVFGYFACSSSELGRTVIARINQTIPTIRAQVAQIYARHLAPGARAAYSALLQHQWGFGLKPE
ncbi:TIGR02285 family protein [Pseudomonas sp. RIT-PI-S]|uniref:TIGR02285 family protein n=1 Tax=Pseudomonas sp. RIT-PI-S TaxID=3035295 RepID=UPI0021DB2124|nr:TIGR02285 family protein [Pseudomonas sp. RIT-PI-S]